MLFFNPRHISFLLSAIALQAFPVWSQTYSWKQVAPFPYFRVDRVINGNNIYVAYGKIVDSLDESSGNKIETGTTPFFMISSDAASWKRISPKAADKSGGGSGREEDIVPLKLFFVNGSFISLCRNLKNEKKIYLSENATTWRLAGIEASSLNFIRDRLIVEHDLAFSVSIDGKKWDTYGAVFPGEPERHKNISKEFRTVSITASDPSSVSFNGDSTRGYYTDSSYVVTDNDRTVGISRDGVHWRVVERPFNENDSIVNDVVGYVYGNKRFVYATSPDGTEGFSFSSSDGKKWEKSANDATDLRNAYGTYSPPTRYERLFFRDSLFYITRIITIEHPESGGLSRRPVQYFSKNGTIWKKNDDAYPEVEYPHEHLPGEWNLDKSSSLNKPFRLNPDGSCTGVVLKGLAPLVFHDDQFLVPVEPHKLYYTSKDGYAWDYKKGNFEASVFYERDPYFKANRTFIEVRQKELKPANGKGSNTMSLSPIVSTCIITSKDKKLWDTVYIDSQMCGRTPCTDRRNPASNSSINLTKFSDGLRLQFSAQSSVMWFSTDGKKWSSLAVKTALDSCHAYAKLNAKGTDRNIYIFPEGTAKLCDLSGNNWYHVNNHCQGAHTVCWGNGRFVASGQDGRIWVLEKKEK
jgi:hypothetical protein